MYIAIRKEEDGSLYIDKRFFDRYTDNDLKRYNYTKVEAPEDCEVVDFNDNLTFSYDKYNARKEQERSKMYEDLVVSKIRQKYSLDQELALLRQRDSKYTEFNEYNEYVEKCKVEAKKEVSYGI